MEYKQFQKDAIKKIVEGYEKGKENNRFLVADEVGLGKTIIAKGVIRCLMYYHYLEEKKKDINKTEFEYKVLYLCSNLNIAEQNKRKLGLSCGNNANFFSSCIIGNSDFGKYGENTDENTGSVIENRTTMILKQKLNNNVQKINICDLREECISILGNEYVVIKEGNIELQNIDNNNIMLNIIPITPNTSIKIRNGGHIEERKFISDILKVVKEVVDNDTNLLKEVLSNIFNEAGNTPSYFTISDEEINRLKNDILKPFTKKLQNLLDNKDLNFNKLSETKYKSILSELKVPEDKNDTWKEGWELLRKWFALASMELLKYDFVVMDEFQNFNDILQKANQTQLAKLKYLNQVKYILAILKEVDNNNQMMCKYKDILCNSYKEIEEDELTEYEKNYWEQKLKNNIESGELCNIGEIIDKFIELAKPDKNLATCIELAESQCEYNDKEKMFQLVKAILCFNNSDEKKQIVWDCYAELNNNTKEMKLSEIHYVEYENGQENECKCCTEDVYCNEKLNQYTIINNCLLNMSVGSDFERFMKDYTIIRRLHPYPLRGVNFEKTPFDYFIYLFLEKGSLSSQLLLNCFQYFYKKNNQSDKAILVWQYAHIFLDKGIKICEYKVEQLEPLRRMLGIYEKRRIDYFENIDEQMILNHIFQNEVIDDKITRIMMLSATPFKMYDNNDEDEQKNANIMEVCDFLDHNAKNNVSDILIKYKNSLLDYSYSNKEIGEVKNDKTNFQNVMNSIFTRMERYAVMRSMNENWFENMTSQEKEGKEQSELPCGQIDKLKEYLKEIKGMNEDSTFIHFAVDSPYIGTFMNSDSKDGKITNEYDYEGYKWKKQWKDKYKDIDFKSDSKVYISYEDYVNNNKPLGLWHGVYNETLRKMLDLDNINENKDNHPGAARLLWIPSCVNKDNLKGPFSDHKDYGKTILFSRYIMTPRMVACLTSYESRRRLCWMIENKLKEGKKDKNAASYIEGIYGKLKSKKLDNSDIKNCTYQYLKGIIIIIKAELCEKLLAGEAGDAFLKKYFESAIELYMEKNNLNHNNDIEGINERKQNLVNNMTKAFANKVLLNDEQGLLAIWASYGFPIIEDNTENIKNSIISECYTKLEKYCEEGCLADVLNEWFYICHESNQDFGDFIGLKKGEFLSYVKESRITIDLYKADENGKIERHGDQKSTNNAVLYFARCIGMSKDDDNVNAIKGLQQAFNSPFAPFVFATTSLGQEGLDFHYYADNIVHWKLPSNPIDFEQREGRINRYHCLAIRKKVIEWWRDTENSKNEADIYSIFTDAFKEAKSIIDENSEQSSIKKCEMIPDWILMNKDKSECANIRRIVPYFYLSKIAKEYNQNLRVLQLYRTVIGQGNPKEIMERLLSSNKPGEVKDLFVDFSPYNNCNALNAMKQYDSNLPIIEI